MKINLQSLALLVVIVLVLGCYHTAPEPVSAPRQIPPESPSSPQEGDAVTSSELDTAERSSPEEPEPLHNTLKWTTASEVDNFGFDIYRSRSEEGPFERITSEPLPGAGTTDEPQSYVFEDSAIEPGVEYFYYIESISLAGAREKFSPVIKARAKP